MPTPAMTCIEYSQGPTRGSLSSSSNSKRLSLTARLAPFDEERDGLLVQIAVEKIRELKHVNYCARDSEGVVRVVINSHQPSALDWTWRRVHLLLCYFLIEDLEATGHITKKRFGCTPSKNWAVRHLAQEEQSISSR